jgi:hypothetical protein
MLRGMSWEQFKEWMAFEKLEPFGPERLEEVVSMITWVLLNQHRGKGQMPLGLHQVRSYFGDMVAPVSVAPKKSSAELYKVVEGIVRTQKMLKATQKRRRQEALERSRQPRIPKVVKIPAKRTGGRA